MDERGNEKIDANKEKTDSKESDQDKKQIKTQTFRDARALTDYKHNQKETGLIISTNKEYVLKIVDEILKEIVDLSFGSKKKEELIADDSKVELLEIKARFEKLPVKESKKCDKSLLSELIGKVKKSHIIIIEFSKKTKASISPSSFSK